MMSLVFFGLAVALALAIAKAIVTAKNRTENNGLLLAVEGDEDIKIASGPIGRAEGDEDVKIASGSMGSRLKGFQDNGESEAREYEHQKQNGNVFKANRLGEELAKPLMSGDKSLLGDSVTAQNIGQLYFLYGFAVRLMVAKDMSHSLLADTVLRSFQETVKSGSDYVYGAINDMVSDTIYRLCSEGKGDIGEGFAKLCSEEDNPRFIRLGQESFDSYRSFVREKISRVEFLD